MAPAALRNDVRDTVIRFVEDGISGETKNEIDSQTPLLTLKLLDSITIIQLLAVLQQQYGVAVPMEKIVGENFANADAIAELVVSVTEQERAAR